MLVAARQAGLTYVSIGRPSKAKDRDIVEDVPTPVE